MSDFLLSYFKQIPETISPFHALPTTMLMFAKKSKTKNPSMFTLFELKKVKEGLYA